MAGRLRGLLLEEAGLRKTRTPTPIGSRPRARRPGPSYREMALGTPARAGYCPLGPCHGGLAGMESRVDRFGRIVLPKGVRDELGTYSREMSDEGEVTEKIKNKERFHRLDALRYIAQTLIGESDAYGETVEAQEYSIGSGPY